MVDTEYRIRRKYRGEQVIELPRAHQVVPERLLDHDPAPPGRHGAAVQPRPFELLAHDGELSGRYRQVKGPVPAGTTLGVEPGDGVGQPIERIVVGKVAGAEPDALAYLLPHLVTELG